MPQDDRLFESLTVEETLLYAARLKLRVNREGRASRVRSVLKALGLTDVHKEVIKNVSGGQRRRTSAAGDQPNAFSLLYYASHQSVKEC